MTTPAPSTLEIPRATSTPSARIPALDGLRGIAILLVVVDHYYASVPTSDGSAAQDCLRRLAGIGFSGVDLFFVLSGFLIGGIVLDHRESPRLLPAFYARRFFRIGPLYALLLASFFIGRQMPGLGTANHGTYFFSSVPVWSYLVFWQNAAMAWARDIGPYWLGVSWSLAVEEQFYLAMPFLIRRLTLRQAAGCCVAVIALAPVFRLYAYYGAQNAYSAIFLLPARADGLMWGVLCACLARSPTARAAIQRHGGLWTALCVAGGIVFGFLAWRNTGADSPTMIAWGYSALAAWFAVLVLGVILFPHAWIVRRLGWRPLTITGITSYFIYLFHVPIWYGLHWGFFHQPPLHFRWPAVGVTALAALVTCGVAQLSWRWLEGPLLKFGRRFTYT